MLKLSNTSKLGCKSFALEAMETCPGAFYADGTVKEVCQGCYATKGFYRMPVVNKVRVDNRAETLKISFVNSMVTLLKKQRTKRFRWFDSGDIESNMMLFKVFEICLQTPEIQHWIPTKSRELFSQDKWAHLECLPNVKVRYSSPKVDGTFQAQHGSTVLPEYQFQGLLSMSCKSTKGKM